MKIAVKFAVLTLGPIAIFVIAFFVVRHSLSYAAIRAAIPHQDLPALEIVAQPHAPNAHLYARYEDLVKNLGKPFVVNAAFDVVGAVNVRSGDDANFQKDGWHIRARLIGNRCLQVCYQHSAKVTPEQLQYLLHLNRPDVVQWDPEKGNGVFGATWDAPDGCKVRIDNTSGQVTITAPEYTAALSAFGKQLQEKRNAVPHF